MPQMGDMVGESGQKLWGKTGECRKKTLENLAQPQISFNARARSAASQRR